MYKLSYMKFSGERYPYIIDLNVLEAIQDKFGSISEFERKVVGVEKVLDKNGQELLEANGSPKMRIVEPNMAAINFILPEMINEGLAIEAEREGKEYKPVNPLLIMADCNLEYTELSRLIHEEFVRRFESKKSKHSESSPKRRKPSTSNGSTTSD